MLPSSTCSPLCGDGPAVHEQDARDGRRQVYRLAPSLQVAETPEGRTMDFGYGLVRLGPPGTDTF